MKSNKLKLLAAAVIAASMTNTQAVELRGSRSCGQWVADGKNGATAYANQAWLVGFLSGMAFESDKDFLKGTDNDSIFLWINNYCQANPLKSAVKAAEALSYELMRQKNISY